MDQESNLPEWKITGKLPEAFVEWLRKTLVEKSMYEKKGFMALADELGIDPALLSRWMAGMGPLTQAHIRTLAKTLSPAIYTALGLLRPNSI